MRKIFTLLALVIASLVFTVPSFAENSTMVAKGSQKSEKELAEEWVLGFMAKHAPPGRKTYYTAAQETKEDALKRYRSIAKDLVEVVYSPTNPVPFGGEYGRARTMSVMLGIMLYESGFAKHVDHNGRGGRGDNGQSWCMMQILVGKGRVWSRAGGWNTKHDRPWRYGDKDADLVKGASGPEMIADRRKCFTEGLRLIKISFRSCSTHPLKERLLVYASGKCVPAREAVRASRLRMTAAIRFWNNTKAEWKLFKDEPVKKLLAAELAEREKQEKALTRRRKKEDGNKKAGAAKAGKPTARKSSGSPAKMVATFR